MAPACILLGRTVDFSDHPQEEEEPFNLGETAKGVSGAEGAKSLAGATTAALPRPSTDELAVSYLCAMKPDLKVVEPPAKGVSGAEGAKSLAGATTARSLAGATTAALSRPSTEELVARYMCAMKPDLKVVEPPEVSFLTMIRPLSCFIPNYARDSAFVAAADKNLVVLFGSNYAPAFTDKGGYVLVDLDADASSLHSLIPGVQWMSPCPFMTTNGKVIRGPFMTTNRGTVIMAREGGAFVLAELLFKLILELPSVGIVSLWQSSSSSWVYKCGELPAQVIHTWRVHMSFPVQSRNRNLFCWVDLLHGLLLCDLGPNCEVKLLDFKTMISFVPLPHGCSINDKCWQFLDPHEFRNAACVDGTIKFVNMDGFKEDGPISLVTYALDLDKPSPSWMEDTRLLLKDLWADKTFISNDVPQIMPVFPILSTAEHDVVYLAIPGDAEFPEGYRFKGAKHLLSVDTCKTRVISATQQKNPSPLLSRRNLLAFTVSHSQWGSKYHQGAVEAIGMGPSAKRIKYE